MNDKIKAFYQKHQVKINISVIALSAVIIALSIKKIDKPKDSLTDEEWEHLFDLARQMDEYVAARKALKTK